MRCWLVVPMSEPRVGVFREHGASGWTWQCSGVHVGRDRWSGFGAEASIAAAADAGRRHLAEHHTTWLVAACECGTYPDPGICHCKGLGNSHCACSHDNPLQTAHNESRDC